MRPSVPAPGAEPRSQPAELGTCAALGPALRSNARSAPTGAHSSRFPFRGDLTTPPPTAGETRPPGSPGPPPGAGAGAAPRLSPTQARSAGRPWLEETPRRTGELGTEWGAYGDPGGRGQRRSWAASFGLPKARSRPDETTIPISHLPWLLESG